MLPSKMIPTTSPFLFTVGEPEFPPMMSAVETKLHGVFEIQLCLGLHPALRQVIGRLVAMLSRVFIGPAQLVAKGIVFPFSW